MIFFFENGRLGNQLFQYYGLKNYFPEHTLFFFGCVSLKEMFNNTTAKFFYFKKNIILRLIKKVFFFF